MRRARKGFEMARGFAPEEAEVAFAKGQQQLELVRRQATISQLYPHQVRSPGHLAGGIFFSSTVHHSARTCQDRVGLGREGSKRSLAGSGQMLKAWYDRWSGLVGSTDPSRMVTRNPKREKPCFSLNVTVVSLRGRGASRHGCDRCE